MDRNRFFLIGAALAAVIVVVGGFLLGVQPQLQAASATNDQVMSIEQQNSANQVQLTALQTAAKNMDAVAAKLSGLRASVPASQAIPSFIEELDAAASAARVPIQQITTADPQVYTNPAPVADTSTTTTGTSTPTPTPTPTAGATATTATGPVAPIPASNPLVTATNFSVIPVSVKISGDYSQALDFLAKVQHGDRLFLVTTVSRSEGSTSSDSGASEDPDWTLGGYIYVLKNSTASSSGTTGTSTSTTQTQAAGK